VCSSDLGKTLEESAYEPPAVSLRRGIPENVFLPRSPPACPTKTFIGHKSNSLMGIEIRVFCQLTHMKNADNIKA
jgi:hypothetical protein